MLNIDDNDRIIHPLAPIINNLSRERLTEALQRTIGQEYFASTFSHVVFAIIRKLPGGMRESACGTSWTEALRKAKSKWAWVISPANMRRRP